MSRPGLPLALTLGDPAGIGPEICARWLCGAPAGLRVVVVGSAAALARAAGRLGPLPALAPFAPASAARLQVLDPEATRAEDLPPPGAVDAEAGRLSHRWVLEGARLVLAGHAAALVTGPIHKEAWARAGVAEPGHTEALARAAGVRRVLMLLVGGRLRTALATIHVPLARVPGLITTSGLLADLTLLAQEVGRGFGPERPRLAVCGLNPHAGEGGLLGTEDAERIRPAVQMAQALGLDVHGPLPADACIPQAAAGAYDAVLAMYHDQALPAVKALAPRRAVNVTLGLPFVRTSVDHGTAFDLAGRGVASERSLVAAVALARRMVRRWRTRPRQPECEAAARAGTQSPASPRRPNLG